jgi:hypothetical protein
MEIFPYWVRPVVRGLAEEYSLLLDLGCTSHTSRSFTSEGTSSFLPGREAVVLTILIE